MHEQSGSVVPGRFERRRGWLGWAGRHAGLVLLGTLAIAFLALHRHAQPAESERDASDEEVPLFI